MGKEISSIENPVVERLGYWLDRVGPKTFVEFLKWKHYGFIPPSIIVSGHDKSIPKEIWFDYVDGFFYWFYLNEDPEVKFSFSKIEKLIKKGIEEIIRFVRRPIFQQVLINKYQYRTDQILIGEGITTILDSEALFRFNQLANEFLIGENSIIELRKKFRERAKKDYGLQGLKKERRESKKPIKKPRPFDKLVWPGAENEIIRYLRKAELIDPESTLWIKKITGYKRLAAQLLKVFYSRFYFKSEPTTEEYKIMLIDIFSITVSSRTIEGAKSEDDSYLIKKFGPIPLFTNNQGDSTIDNVK
jgi:hypothetical protein